MMKRAVATLAVLIIAGAGAAFAGDKARCRNCLPPKTYDSQEVVKTTREIDHSRVINTQSVVPVGRRVVTKNHLVIHENETRHVGTVRHHHTIIEKEIRYRRPPVTIVNFVTHRYIVTHRPDGVRGAASGCARGKGVCRRVLQVRG